MKESAIIVVISGLYIYTALESLVLLIMMMDGLGSIYTYTMIASLTLLLEFRRRIGKEQGRKPAIINFTVLLGGIHMVIIASFYHGAPYL